MKRAFLFFVMLSLSIHMTAQTNIEPLLDSYLQKAKDNADMTLVFSKLQNIYQKRTDTTQQAFRNQIYQKIKSFQKEERNDESVLLIDLYEHFAADGDKQMPLLYYVKGQICAEQKDSITLKLCIADLQGYPIAADNAIPQYIAELEQQLSAIRNYKPLVQQMDGVWVSNLSIKRSMFDQQIPLFILFVLPQSDTPDEPLKFLLGGSWSAEHLKKENDRTAQKVISEGDICMALWGNEKVKTPDQEIRGEMKKMTEGIHGVAQQAIQESGGTLLERTTANMMDGMINAGLSALIDGLFTPTKKINMATCTFQAMNPYEIKAKIHTRTVKVKGTNEPTIEDEDYEVIFTKWNQKWDFGYWVGTKGMFFPYPLNIEDNKIPDTSQMSFGEQRKVLQKLYNQFRPTFMRYLPFVNENEAIDAYNVLTTQRAFYLNRQEAQKERFSVKNNGTWLGCEFETLPEKLQKKGQEKGVVVSDVDKLSPAQLYGIKKKDILLDIDGVEVNSVEQAEEQVSKLTPFEFVKLSVLRKQKVISILVEPSYQINVIPTNK